MTINDLLDNLITLQGEVTVKSYNYETDKYTYYDYNTDDIRDREIKFMYAQDNELVIEIEEE